MGSIPPQRAYLESHVDWRPDETAIRFADTDESLTFAEFGTLANQFANAMHDRGVRYGDRVGMVLFNTREFPIALYGCHKLGAMPVAVNTQLAADDIAYIFDDMNAEALVYDTEIRETVETAAADSVSEHHLIGAGFEPDDGESFEAVLSSGSDERPPEFRKAESDPSYMFYTSGTTGKPKGVVHSVKSGRERSNSAIIECGISSESISLALLPWYHGAGIDITIRATVSAGAEIIVLKHPDVERSLEVIEEYGVSHVMSVPSLSQRFVEHESIDDRDLSSVDNFMHTGEVLTEKHARTFHEVLSENIYNLYGSSESGISTVLKPDALPEQAGTVGLPAKGVEARIVEPESSGLPDPDNQVPRGEQGELIVRTDQLFSTYFENEAEARTVKRDGWYFTNDLAIINDDGYIEVTGRADDMIISGGELISPIEVEEAIERHDAVAGAIVVGHEDDQWGQRVTAYVSGDGSLETDDLDRFLKESDHLADFKRPKAYNIIDELPRTGANKKKRAEFRD
ncbi:class I adenylate-forming enzyme family protein [Halovivax limisalsi]|uniref:class I adenylate-forming enzyme family protein n=1 Tax=Halovivax limisalsi TaxID=1453760 RepID=UPI001FFD4A70|nr:class I adenylate-forming enzyme family protein [Halovivax limisalsi]